MEVWSMLLHTMKNFKSSLIPTLRQLILLFAFATVFLLRVDALAPEQAPPLLVMISVDGMRPDYITEADRHGAKVPNLRRFLREGTYAEGGGASVTTHSCR